MQSDDEPQSLIKLGEVVENRIIELNKAESKLMNSYSNILPGEKEEGSGPIRINESINLCPDLYSMLFVTSMFSEYLYIEKRKMKNKEELIDQIIKNRPSEGDDRLN